MPKELRRILTQATEKGWVWSSWAHKFQTRLFTAEMSLSLSRERGTPVMHIKRYSDDLLEDSARGRPTSAARGTAARTKADE